MTTMHKRSIRAKLHMFMDDLSWHWDRNKVGFYEGFAFGVFVVLMATYFVIGLT